MRRDRSLQDYQAPDVADRSVKHPSYELQMAAARDGYKSVTDMAVDQCIAEIKALTERVKQLEEERGC